MCAMFIAWVASVIVAAQATTDTEYEIYSVPAIITVLFLVLGSFVNKRLAPQYPAPPGDNEAWPLERVQTYIDDTGDTSDWQEITGANGETLYVRLPRPE